MNILLAFLTVTTAYAQDYLGAASNIINAAVATPHKKAAEKNTIQGDCKFMGSWCAGSSAKLKNADNQVLQSLIISSADSLKFARVMPGVYQVEIISKDGKASQTIKNLKPGDAPFSAELN